MQTNGGVAPEIFDVVCTINQAVTVRYKYTNKATLPSFRIRFLQFQKRQFLLAFINRVGPKQSVHHERDSLSHNAHTTHHRTALRQQHRRAHRCDTSDQQPARSPFQATKDLCHRHRPVTGLRSSNLQLGSLCGCSQILHAASHQNVYQILALPDERRLVSSLPTISSSVRAVC